MWGGSQSVLSFMSVTHSMALMVDFKFCRGSAAAGSAGCGIHGLRLRLGHGLCLFVFGGHFNL